MKKQIASALILSGALVSMTSYCVLNQPQIKTVDTTDSNLGIATSGVVSVQSSYTAQEVPAEVWTYGFTTTKCNIRKEASEESEILDTYNFNSIVYFTVCTENDEWVKIRYYEGYAYIKKEFISLEECSFRVVAIPSYSGFKSFMGYEAITSTNSPQFKLQRYAYTGDYGIRMVNGRYLVAIGTGTNASVGDYVDLVLYNGTVIPCIVGDIKAPQDTDSSNLITVHSNCATEFIVDSSALSQRIKSSGDVSSADESWNSRCVEMMIYNKNVLE